MPRFSGGMNWSLDCFRISKDGLAYVKIHTAAEKYTKMLNYRQINLTEKLIVRQGFGSNIFTNKTAKNRYKRQEELIKLKNLYYKWKITH